MLRVATIIRRLKITIADIVKFKSHQNVKVHLNLNRILFYSISIPFISSKFFTKEVSSPQLKYWLYADQEELIKVADELYVDDQFIEAYELLNKIKYHRNPEILWRIARALHKISTTASPVTTDIKKRMIQEGIDILNYALSITDSDANIHKWIAILLDCKNSLDGVKAKVSALEDVKYHLLKAVEIDETQTSLLFMLGKISYDLASLTWFQRKIANVVFTEPPQSSYEEAYEYFLKAERISPGFYVGNLVMLGKTCIKLKWFHRARYYFTLATSVPVTTEDDKKLQAEAIELAKSLDAYDISKESFKREKMRDDTEILS